MVRRVRGEHGKECPGVKAFVEEIGRLAREAGREVRGSEVERWLVVHCGGEWILVEEALEKEGPRRRKGKGKGK